MKNWSIFKCPSDTRKIDWTRSGIWQSCSYAMNYQIAWGSDFNGGYPVDPNGTIYIWCGRNRGNGSYGYCEFPGYWASSLDVGDAAGYAKTHAGMVPIIYNDLHIGVLSKKELLGYITNYYLVGHGTLYYGTGPWSPRGDD